ncbi:hypothetical protein [Roseomonas sp. SXEYE001]|nr:hypothetical protein [Roseomonas sp. SXEYE001]
MIQGGTAPVKAAGSGVGASILRTIIGSTRRAEQRRDGVANGVVEARQRGR